MIDKLIGLLNEPVFSVFLTVGFYLLYVKLNQLSNKLPLINPTVLSGITLMLIVHFSPLTLASYKTGGSYITFFLAPLTIALGFSVYNGWALLKKYSGPLIVGTVVAVISAVVTTKFFSWALGLDHTIYLALMPKSVTTPIGLTISQRIGAINELVVVGIILAGLVGALTGSLIFKMLKIESPMAQGYSLGAASHVLGTSKAIEMGTQQGAAASAAIGIVGLAMVVGIELVVLLGWL